MANIIPQNPDINRYFWIDTEEYERKKAKEFGSLQVVIGVEYPQNPMRIGESELAVPSAFYKMLQNDSFNFKECFYYENIPIYDTATDTLKEHLIECDTLVLDYSI